MKSPPPTYRRGQVTHAIWRTLSLKTGREVGDPPSVFAPRIQTLNNLDQKMPPPKQEGKSAFRELGSVGRGADTLYTEHDTFALALGLDLLDIGFQPHEVVYLLQRFRSRLDAIQEEVIGYPQPTRQNVRPDDAPTFPTRKWRGTQVADFSLYILIQKIELTELHPGRVEKPFFLEPKICRGLNELSESLGRMGIEFRKVLVLEVWELAHKLRRNLERAPALKRGRR